MRFRTPAASFPRLHRPAHPSRTLRREHPVLDLQRTIGNQATLRLLQQGAPGGQHAAPMPPAQVAPPCQCGGTCPLCSHEEHEREGARAPAQDDVEFIDFETEAESDTPDLGMLPPDVAVPSERGVETGAAPPLEAGWWTGDWYTGKNTIICDGDGSLTIHEATSYKHGVQDCTRQHENSHKGDWYARYGNDICKGRKKGDLPHFNPEGKEKYGSFVKSSECTAWKIGQTCRNEKLAACADDDCKNYVKTFTAQADKQVKKYCGD